MITVCRRLFVSLLLPLVIPVNLLAQDDRASSAIIADTAHSQALADARKAIDRGNALWVEAWKNGDPALLSSLFSDDGCMLAGHGKLIKGRPQILGRYKEVMKGTGPGVRAVVTTVDLWLDGDTAYETGKYSYTYEEGGKSVTEGGRYVTTWRRQTDGSWKIIVDMGVPQD